MFEKLFGSNHLAKELLIITFKQTLRRACFLNNCVLLKPQFNLTCISEDGDEHFQNLNSELFVMKFEVRIITMR